MMAMKFLIIPNIITLMQWHADCQVLDTKKNSGKSQTEKNLVVGKTEFITVTGEMANGNDFFTYFFLQV